MHVIIAGGGPIGCQLAASLAAAGMTVTVVEADPARATAIAGPGIDVVAGNACVAASLEAAGALRAGTLVACTGSDEENLVIALLAKRYLEVPLVVARINDVGNRWLFDDSWGVDVAVSLADALSSAVSGSAGDRPHQLPSSAG